MPPAKRTAASSGITVPGNRGIKIVRCCTILAPRSELYDFWRDFSHLPEVIRDPVQIRVINDTESEWTVSAPLTKHLVTWRAQIINEKPPGLIAWRTPPDAEVPHAGSIRFEPAPGEEGTEVTVALEYDPPGGKLGGLLAKLSPEEPGRQVSAALRRFKALFEAGEIPTIDGQSVGEPQLSKQQE